MTTGETTSTSPTGPTDPTTPTDPSDPTAPTSETSDTSNTAEPTSTTEATGETTVGGPRCGDGVIDADESCDDGNISNADSCLANCTPASCGDGFIWLGEEACDAGDDNDDTGLSGCRTDCTVPSCGDGALYPITFGSPIELAMSGEPTIAKLPEVSPKLVAIDGAGQIYAITDWVSGGGLLNQAVVERYDPEGQLVGGPLFVAEEFQKKVARASVDVNLAGDLIVTWETNDDGDDVLYRRFTSLGDPLTDEFSAATNRSGQQKAPTVAMNGSGDAVIAFRAINGPDPSNNNVIRVRQVPAGGELPADFVVSVDGRNASAPSVSIREDGSFAVAYTDLEEYAVFARSYSSDGELELALDPIEGLRTSPSTNLPWVGVAALEGGELAIAGLDVDSNLRVRRYDLDGGLVFDVIASEAPLPSVPRIDVAADLSGNLSVLWGSCDGEELVSCKSDPSTLYLRRIDSDGALFEKPFTVAVPSWDGQGISIATSADGDLAIVAENNSQPFLMIGTSECP